MTRGDELTLEEYERAVSRLCAQFWTPEGYREDVTARSMPLEEIAMELQELAERRANCRTAR